MTACKPKISVIMPTYNRACVLPRAIESVLRQDFCDFELLIVDDASTDRTQELVARFRDERLRYLRKGRNEGGAAARNAGIRCARAGYLAFLDSDDEWLPAKLQKQARFLDQSPAAIGAVFTGAIMQPSGRSLAIRVPSGCRCAYRALLERNVLQGGMSTAMIRSVCFEKIGLFDANLPASQDYDLWLRLARLYEMRVIPDQLAIIHAEGPDRLTKNLKAKIFAAEYINDKIKDDLAPFQLHKRKAMQKARFGYLQYLGGEVPEGRARIRSALARFPFAGKIWLYWLGTLIPLREFQRLRARVKGYKPLE